MKFIYKFAIGIIIFNAMLIFVAALIPDTNPTIQEGAENIDSTYDVTNLQGLLGRIFISNPWGFGIFAALSLIGIGGVITGRTTPLFLGISIIFGFMIWALTGTVNVITQNISEYTHVSTFVNIILFVIGLIALLSAGDILTSRSDVN